MKNLMSLLTVLFLFSMDVMAAITVSGLVPNSGFPAGGNTVTITGTGMSTVNYVDFNGTQAVIQGTPTSTSVVVIVPNNYIWGPVDVYLSKPNGDEIYLSAAYTYLEPVINTVTPNQGGIEGGTPVTINGSHFEGINAVSFDYNYATSVTVVNATTITAVTPAAGYGAGPVIVQIETDVGTIDKPDAFTYTSAVVTSVEPSSGSIAGGTSVTITGTGLNAVLSVYIGGAEVQIASQTDTTIVVTTDAMEAGIWPITFYLTTGEPLDPGRNFTYTNPVINTALPASGPVAGGTAVTLTGTGLNAVEAVYIGGNDATITTHTDTTIVVTTPVLAAGVYSIELSLNSVAPLLNTGYTFTYLTAQINAVAPAQLSSIGGETIVITGAYFTGVQDLSIGGNSPGSFTIDSDTQITAVTPGYITGAANVELAMADGSIVAGAQTLTFNPPQISSFSPAQGPAIGGTNVTVSGSYFTPAITSLQLSGTNASNLQYVNSSTLTLTTPAGSVGNVNAWLQASTGANYFFDSVFTYLAPPALSNISPNSTDVNGGITVTITGNNFSQGMTATIAGFSLSNVTYVNATTLTATVPALPEGIHAVTVTNTSGETATLAGAFLVRPSPLFMAGDLAPLNAPDSVLNIADVMVLQRMVNGLVTPTPLQEVIGDIAPLGNPDGELNVADVMLLQRAVNGMVTLPVAIENRPPQISIVSPADGGYVTSSSVTLIGLLNEQGIVEVNGVAVPVDNMLTFTQNIAVNEGSNSIIISATDIYGNTSTRNVTVYRDTKPPAPIDINRVSITSAGGIATVTGSAGSVEANATVNVTVDTQLYTATANTDGSFTLQLDASNGELLQIHVSDLADNVSATVGYTLGASLQILAPLANSTIADNKVNIVGVYVGEQNSGISVNGSPACTYNNHFYVNNVPLVTGSNTLTAVHTLQTGTTEMTTRSVNGSAASAYELTADNNCGMAPLTVSFALTGSNITQLDIDYDNNGSVDLSTTTPTTSALQHIYTTAGVYPVTAWITTASGVQQRSLNIVVQDPLQQTDQLKLLWNNMRTALTGNNKAAAMQALCSEAQNTYDGIFDALMPHMAEVFGELSNIEPISNNNDIASYAIIRAESGVNKTYIINFIKGNDGVWRIDSM